MTYTPNENQTSRHAPERHASGRLGWLRAAVLGANDGIVSTASLVVGVSAAGADANTALVTGVAGLVAGAMSMAAGEYVSVSTQADAERADLVLEAAELETAPKKELEELAGIYRGRGLEPELALAVASALTKHDPLGAHARDELGITDQSSARPMQAAWASAGAFAVGAALSLGPSVLESVPLRIGMVAAVALLSLSSLGALGARLGGAPPLRATLRVTLGGTLAIALTAGVGAWFGAAL